MEILPFKKPDAGKNSPTPENTPINPKFPPIQLGASSAKPLNKGATPSTYKTLHELATDPLGTKHDNPKSFFKDWAKSWGDQYGNFISDFNASKHPITSISEGVAHSMKTFVDGVSAVFAPITGFFEASKDVPVLSSVAKLVTLPFAMATDVTDDTAVALANKVIDSTDMTPEHKASMKEATKGVFDTIAQIWTGEVGIEKIMPKLTEKVGPADANTIVEQADNIVKHKLTIEQQIMEEFGKKPTEETIKAVEGEQIPGEKPATSKEGEKMDSSVFPKEKRVEEAPKKITPESVFGKDEIASLKKRGYDDKMIQMLAEKSAASKAPKIETPVIKETTKEEGGGKQESSKEEGPKSKEQPIKPFGTGETRVSKASQRLGSEEPLTYQSGEDLVRQKSAKEAMTTDYSKGIDAAMGRTDLPKNVQPGDMLAAARAEAQARGDVKTLKELSNSPLTLTGTAAGQIVQSFASIDPTDAAAHMEDIRKAKEESLIKETKTKDIKSAKIKTLENIIKKLEC